VKEYLRLFGIFADSDAACVAWLPTTFWEYDSVFQDHLPSFALGFTLCQRYAPEQTGSKKHA